jgi:pyruvate kinase
MSRISSGIPIYAFSSQLHTLGKVTLYRGVFPMYFSNESQDHATVNREIVDLLRAKGQSKNGDKIIITKGDLTGQQGGTSALKVVTIGEGLTP